MPVIKNNLWRYPLMQWPSNSSFFIGLLFYKKRKKLFSFNSFLPNILFPFPLIIFLSSCTSTPPLEQWVKDRGYEFHKDYSTINSLGWMEDGKGNLLKNPNIAITEEEFGSIPDFEKNQNHEFKIVGKVDVQKFLRLFGGVQLEGNIEKIESAEIILENPHIKIAKTMVPVGICKKNNMFAATKVLNTGSMSVKIKDSLDNNITGTFNIKNNQGSAGIETKRSDELSLKGEGFNVGYVSQNLKCIPKGNPEEVKLIKGQSAQAGGVYFYYRFFSDGINNTESLPIATIYIAPSAFMAKMGRIDQILTASVQLSKIQAEDEIQALIEPIEIVLSESNSMMGQIAMLQNQLKEQEERSKELDQVVHALQINPPINTGVYTAQVDSKNNRIFYQPSRRGESNPIIEGIIMSERTPAKDSHPSISWDFHYEDKPTKYGRVFSSSQPISKSDKDEYQKIKEREKEVQESQIKIYTQADRMKDLLKRVAKQKTITEEKNNLVAKFTSKSGSLLIEPGLYNLTFASGLSIPSGPATSSIYLEVAEVNKAYVKILLQKMNLEIENITTDQN